MPVRFGKTRGGADAFLHTCEECGEYACFGDNVHYRQALNAIHRNQIELAKELLGTWYCLTHWRIRNENNPI